MEFLTLSNHKTQFAVFFSFSLSKEPWPLISYRKYDAGIHTIWIYYSTFNMGARSKNIYTPTKYNLSGGVCCVELPKEATAVIRLISTIINANCFSCSPFIIPAYSAPLMLCRAETRKNLVCIGLSVCKQLPLPAVQMIFIKDKPRWLPGLIENWRCSWQEGRT